MPARNTLHLYLIPIILIAVLFFLFTPYRPYQTGLTVDDDGNLNPGSTLNSGLSLGGIEEQDAVDWELEKTLKGVQGTQEMGGEEEEDDAEEMMEAEEALRSNNLVQLDLTVMSRCPDARICEAVIDKVVAEPSVRNKINLTLNYIGKPDPRSTYAVKCMHGDIECRGNIQQLCVQHILDPRRSKSGSPRAEFDMEQEDDGGVIPTNPEGITLNPIFPGMSFVSAQNYYDPRKIGQEEYAISSLKSIGYSWTESGVADCVEGEQGKELLLASVVRSRDELKQSKSCTILVGGKKRCVHDGGWYDCDGGHEVSDFVKTIEEEWESLQRED